jgi:hypothetical protein
VKKLLLICTLTFLPAALSQPALPRIQAHNANGWWNYFGDHPIGDSKWGAHLEIQGRRSDILPRFQQVLIRPAVNYAIHPNITLTFGYAYVDTGRYGEYPVATPFPEHRVFQQAQVVHKIGKVNNFHRYRLEQRELGEMSVSTTGDRSVARWRHENRFRYMYRVALPLKGRWGLALYDEIFVNFGKNVAANVFDQNRAYGAITYNITKKNRLEIGFMEQTLQQRNGRVFENNHTLMVSWFSTSAFGKRKD